MVKKIILIQLFIAIVGNVGATSFYLLQISSPRTDPTSLLLAGYAGLITAVVTLFLTLRKSDREKVHTSENYAKTVQDVYEKIITQVNHTIMNNNAVTKENTEQTKELKNAIEDLPKEFKQIIRELISK